jgi:hypothetical protein
MTPAAAIFELGVAVRDPPGWIAAGRLVVDNIGSGCTLQIFSRGFLNYGRL